MSHASRLEQTTLADWVEHERERTPVLITEKPEGRVRNSLEGFAVGYMLMTVLRGIF